MAFTALKQNHEAKHHETAEGHQCPARDTETEEPPLYLGAFSGAMQHELQCLVERKASRI
jgi:hypothetical protein